MSSLGLPSAGSVGQLHGTDRDDVRDEAPVLLLAADLRPYSTASSSGIFGGQVDDR
ncbi:hypothetical protein VE03_01212 [Pseudogymnoascus sp. 23342-1-I1]|nr:hypothetical protein VE03_01212 [Pseudogymnoascus sp. 23342-1-I1]